MLREIDALGLQELGGLGLNHLHLLAKLDFTAVEVQEEVTVQGVHDLLLLCEVLCEGQGSL